MMLKKYWARIVGALLMILCYGLAVFYNGKMMSDNPGTATAVLTENRLDAKSASEIQKTELKQDNPLLFTIWGEKENAKLSNKQYQRNSSATAVLVCNNPQLLFNGTAALAPEDTRGCLIDEKTAYDLFGSTDVVGKQLEYQDRKLTVRGILKGIDDERQMVVMQADGDAQNLDSITVQVPEGKEAETIVNELLMRHALEGKIMDLNLLKGITRIFILLLPIFFAFGIMFTFLRYAKEEKGQGISAYIWWGALIVMLIMTIWGVTRFITIPKEMIPTKWSDFDFWTNLWKKKEEAFLFLIQSAKHQPQIDMILAFFHSVFFSMLSIILYFMSFRKRREILE